MSSLDLQRKHLGERTWRVKAPAVPVRLARSRSHAWPELELLGGVGRARRYGAYRVRTVERPARALGADRADAMRGMCVRASSGAFGIDLSGYWRTRPDYFGAMSEWCVADRDGDLAGWHGISVWQGACGTVLYTDMLVTLPHHRRSGLGAFLVHDAWRRVAMRRRCLPIVACRTQNPVVLRMMSRFAPIAYPRPDGRAAGRHYERAAQAAAVVARERVRGCPPAEGTFIARGALPCALCPDRPAGAESAIDLLFAQLDVAAGDAVVVIGMVTPTSAARAFARHAALRMRLAITSARV